MRCFYEKSKKKNKENKELRAQEFNKAAGGIVARYVKCPRCKRTYTLTCCDDGGCPYCERFW